MSLPGPLTPRGYEPREECPLGMFYLDPTDGVLRCRCIICARCHQHTGSTTHGHWWSLCRLTKAVRQHHFCCPNGCELGADSSSGSAVPPI